MERGPELRDLGTAPCALLHGLWEGDCRGSGFGEKSLPIPKQWTLKIPKMWELVLWKSHPVLGTRSRLLLRDHPRRKRSHTPPG